MSETVQKVKETLEEYKTYQKRLSEARGRPYPGLMPSRVTPKVFTRFTEIEKKFCKPAEVVVEEATVHPEGDVCVQLKCPGGATRKRCFSADQAKCYFDCAATEKIVAGKEPSAKDKTKCALVCANSMTPTLTEQFTGEDVKREPAAKVLDEMMKEGDVSAEQYWEKYHIFPPKPPRITDEQLYESRVGKYFAGEPIHEVTPKGQEKWSKELAEKEREARG
ncbi:hypothetical protein CH330_01245 [candidate division WOR-3 bacterium JGI_Cruoil_03_51_56]|uniref:Uncharacterized protein n=1 Tax=candidate division WOR-3 bacterium JGI_Cruoil_03_51_56 TaxID=1973747 RepID=A0A235BXE4_UNCW3|nr:MAG: hypothetical protein CH330_01245 [candidate division WOR-3 bacterium JGI_Cruoil_03_51_56]